MINRCEGWVEAGELWIYNVTVILLGASFHLWSVLSVSPAFSAGAPTNATHCLRGPSYGVEPVSLRMSFIIRTDLGRKQIILSCVC